MMRLWLAVVALLLFAGEAIAHTRSQSFSTWTVDGATLSGVYQVDAYRVTQLSEVPKDLAVLLREHLDRRIFVQQLGMVCKRERFEALSAPHGELRVEFKFVCAAAFTQAPAALVIGGFFDVSISHVHYARLTDIG